MIKKLLFTIILLGFIALPSAAEDIGDWNGSTRYADGWSEWSLENKYDSVSKRATIYISVNGWTSTWDQGSSCSVTTTCSGSGCTVSASNGRHQAYNRQDGNKETGSTCTARENDFTTTSPTGAYPIKCDCYSDTSANPYCTLPGVTSCNSSNSVTCGERSGYTNKCWYYNCGTRYDKTYGPNCVGGETFSSTSCGTATNYYSCKSTTSFKDEKNKSNWKQTLSSAGGYAKKFYVYSYPLDVYVNFDGNGSNGVCDFTRGSSNVYNNDTTIKYELGNPVCGSNDVVNGTMPKQAISYINGGNLNTIKYYRYGYDFKGWSVNKNSNVVSYVNGEAVTATKLGLGPAETITLYAVWEKHTYSVSFEKLCGTVSNITYQYQDNKTLPTLDTSSCTEKNVNFLGWYEDVTYTQKLDKIPTSYYKDLTLYAKESQKRYFNYSTGKWTLTN